MRALLILFLSAILLSMHSCRPKTASVNHETRMHYSKTESQFGAPCSIVFHNGEYHMFFQEFKRTSSGRISKWGHARSNDLIHWQDMPLEIKYNSQESIGTGSVIIDNENVSGIGKENSAMLAFYTSDNVDIEQKYSENRTVHVASSTDDGITWEEQPSLSFFLNDCPYAVKDPKVFWYDESQSYLMLVLSGYEVRFYSSLDLQNWSFLSAFGDAVDDKVGEWSHLEFSNMRLESTGEKFWVLFISGDEGSPNGGGGTQYYVGDFDGFEFIPNSHKPKWVDNGSDNFAGVTVTNVFEKNEPTYYMGLISNGFTKNINHSTDQTYTLPRKIFLTKKFNGLYIQSTPLNTLKGKDKEQKLFAQQEFAGEFNLGEDFVIPTELNLKFDVNNRVYLDFPEVFGMELSNGQGEKIIIGYHSLRRYFFISQIDENDKSRSELSDIVYAFYAIEEPVLNFKVIIDKSSIELFAVNGLVSLTKKVSFLSGKQEIKLFAEKGTIKLVEGEYFKQ